MKAKQPQKTCADLAGYSTTTSLKRGASLGCVIPPSALAHSSTADNSTARFVSRWMNVGPQNRRALPQKLAKLLFAPLNPKKSLAKATDAG